MGGGQVKDLKITAIERAQIIKEIEKENEQQEDNDYMLVSELADVLHRDSTVILKRLKKLKYKLKKVFINRCYCTAVTIADGKAFIREARGK